MKNIIALCLFATSLFTAFSYAQDAYKTETIVGIGATLEKLQDGTVHVVSLIPNAPAEHAGLESGDIIVAVKSLPNSAVIDVRSLDLADVAGLIRGPVGVPVEITYTRGQSGLILLSIVREPFEVDDSE